MKKTNKALRALAIANNFTYTRKVSHGELWKHGVTNKSFSMGGTPRNKTYYAINVVRAMREASGDNTIPYL